jgi:hypothetical protein
MSSCFVFSTSSGSNRTSSITTSNINQVLDGYYKWQNLPKENNSYWSSSQDFNQNNYVLSALSITITYNCCNYDANGKQLCDNSDVLKLYKGLGIINTNYILTDYSTFLSEERTAWFATIGLIEGTNLGVIIWRGSHSKTDFVADFNLFDFYGEQSEFKTCSGIDIGNETFPPYFDVVNSVCSKTPLVHQKSLSMYNSSYIKVDGKTYSVYGAVKTYPKDTQWIIAGHSLGAALANMCCADLSARGININSCYLFADPNPGNDVYSSIYSSIPCNINNKKMRCVYPCG